MYSEDQTPDSIYNSLDANNKMSFLNPEWKLNDNNIDKDSDKIIAYLCNTSIWDGYANNLARYAVGAPSVEMWIDGYNAHLRYNSQYLTNGSVLGTEVWKEEFKTEYRNTGDAIGDVDN